jgi:hypothetical protein
MAGFIVIPRQKWFIDRAKRIERLFGEGISVRRKLRVEQPLVGILRTALKWT